MSFQSAATPGQIFNTGLAELTNFGVTSFKEVAPIWVKKALKLDEQSELTDRPTFQETGGTRIADDQPLTTEEVQKPDLPVDKEVQQRNRLLLMVGLGFLGFMLLKGN